MGLSGTSRKKVSNHAKQRCLERFGVSNKVMKEIMRTGFTVEEFEGDFHSYLMGIKVKKGGAVNVKVKGNMLVVYNKRSQRAITTWVVPGKYQPIERFLIPKLKEKYLPKKLGEYLWTYLRNVGVIEDGDRSTEKSE